MFFLYRAIILSVNSRLPVPVCMFVLVTHLIHRTCVTSRCQMNFYRCPVHYGIYILFTTPTNALFIKLGKGKIDIALHIFIASTFFRSSTILRELVQSLAEVIISAKTFSKIMSSYIVWRCGSMLHVMFFLYRAIILSVNSRFPVPVCLFVLVTHLIHRTCVTSRCPTVLKHFQTVVLMNSRTTYVLRNRN